LVQKLCVGGGCKAIRPTVKAGLVALALHTQKRGGGHHLGFRVKGFRGIG
jgi:hypothetical protein